MASLLYRLGRWCADHVKTVIAAWLIVLAALGGLPGRHVAPPLVVAGGLAVGQGVLLAEVGPAGLGPIQRVEHHQFRQLEEVRDPAGLLQLLVEPVRGAGDQYVAPEFVAERPHLVQCGAQPGVRP